ncbi:TonB-dependent receptor [Zhongshania aquimaris]|uniref:TonB-dependent receptor n=1 Tax=Zhongshania aquimaris TaxID=2857107 RepID=A0ABS6VV36_9GAMM|nr:TonB-dependent receptor [Zhongshania aquimaris]MBW2942200.1 TonB-dependent receptor [Zhongshania aquimaris]
MKKEMKMGVKSALTCASSFAVMLQCSPVLAADGGVKQLEEVVVSARRVSESLQDVPTAVSAMPREELEGLRIDGFQTVAQSVPNVYIQKQGGTPSAPQMQIRGISNGSLNMQVDSGIGLYIDGVYLGRAGGAAFDLADLERVEVLRGPQGTLFGRNSTGGAINLITGQPSGEFNAKIVTGVGNFGQKTLKGMIELPVWNGISTKLNLGHTEREGDVRNTAQKRTFNFPAPFGSITTNERGGDDESDNIFFAASYDGIDNLFVTYKFDRTEWDGTLNYRQIGSLDPSAAGTLGLLTEVTPFNESFAYSDRLAVPLESQASLEVEGHSITVEYDLSDEVQIKYIGAKRKFDQFSGGNQVWGASEYIDTSGNFGPAGGVFAPLFTMRIDEQNQVSHEFQLIGATEGVSWILGAFYFNEEGAVNAPIFLFRSIGDTSVIAENSIGAGEYFVGQNYSVDNKSIAYYAHATYSFERFDVSGGARYSEDDRRENVIMAGVIANQNFKTTGYNGDYDISLTYNIDDDINFYGKYATGYVSGGTLGGSAFDKETVQSFELGVKSDLMDRRLRLNAAVFTMNRKDTQIEGFTGVGYFMGKGDEMDSSGLELEVNYLYSNNFSVNASYGYTDVDGPGELRTFQPEQTAYLGLKYELPIFYGMSQRVRVDTSWRSDVHRLACRAGQDQVAASDTCTGTANYELDGQAELGSTTMVGASYVLDEITIGGSVARVTLWGKNLLDEDAPEYSFTLGGSTIASTFVRPRTFGVDFQVEF